MVRPAKFDKKKQQRVVLAVLRGELGVAEAARRHGSSEASVARWRDRFIEGGVAALENGSRRGPERAGGPAGA
jgi:transposase